MIDTSSIESVIAAAKSAGMQIDSITIRPDGTVIIGKAERCRSGSEVKATLSNVDNARVRPPVQAGKSNVADSISIDVAEPEAIACLLESSGPYITADTRRFSDIIEPTIAAIQRSGDWNQDMAQRRRVINAFAWITGDKRLCDYRPEDAELFAQTLARLPATFRWGTRENGIMSCSYTEVMQALPVSRGHERSARTLNRDLIIMARVARELAKVAWRAKLGGSPIMSFSDFMIGIRENACEPDRMPWTEDNLRAIFSSPIYTGGAGCSKRLRKSGSGNFVWQDAAYWVPLLMAFTFLAREEACGLECVDFVFNVETPYLVVRANLTRSKDGIVPAGLKRPSRFRMIPLHPELLRLGLQVYVERMAQDGHAMIFPELYQTDHTRRGGTRFYASSGRYLLAYVDDVSPLLRTRKGKRADLHSMRTSGASALEDMDAKQLQVDDIMGHARSGTGPRKYSRAWYSKGGDVILAERLKLIITAMPNVTEHLVPHPLRLLPLVQRSRTGSHRGCVSRQGA